MMQSRSIQHHRTLKIFLTNFLLVLFGIIILELVFGNWFHPNRINRLNLPRNVMMTFNIKGLYQSEDQFVVYTRDVYGLRGSYKSLDSIDILTIGGSSTDQRYITDGKTWQDILAREFRTNGKDISIVNAGVDGQSTYGHIKNFEWWFPFISDLKVKYFLFYIGVNDYYKDEDYRFDKLLPANFLLNTMREHSALYYLYRTVYGMYKSTMVFKVAHRPINFLSIQYTTAPNILNHSQVVHARVLSFQRRLKILVEKVKARNSTPIFVTQPSRMYKLVDSTILGDAELSKYDNVIYNGVDFYYMRRFFDNAMHQVCDEAGGIWIDLARDVAWEDQDFYDFFHNTPHGAGKIGQHLYFKLQHLF